ncbi:aldolase/citrate lyase family protein [Saccharopolyspora sp. NPDC047091]|uniref:HpcH/HpaI aldolase family protein n=1 Tax=Saccharopolyspora sp. NPDC047091 TaxID=3155924 RepID=UPI0033D78453
MSKRPSSTPPRPTFSASTGARSDGMRCPGVRSPESRYPSSSPAGHPGFDFVLIDTEHGLADSSELEHHLRAADAAGIAALVRVGSNDPLWTLRVLDAGATGIVVPHISTEAEAHAAASAAHYPPRGTRGPALSARAGRSGTVSMQRHLADAARGTVVVAQAEDTESVDNIGAITATGDLNAVWIGPSDLPMSLGRPGEMDRPEVVAAIDEIVEGVLSSPACRLAVLVDDVEDADRWRARGATMLLFNHTTILQAGHAPHRGRIPPAPGVTLPISIERNRGAVFTSTACPMLPLPRSGNIGTGMTVGGASRFGRGLELFHASLRRRRAARTTTQADGLSSSFRTARAGWNLAACL